MDKPVLRKRKGFWVLFPNRNSHRPVMMFDGQRSLEEVYSRVLAYLSRHAH